MGDIPPFSSRNPPWFGDYRSFSLGSNVKDSGRWPSITIVTPSLNRGAFLEETIRSIVLQGYPRLEFIVIDGGSSDGSVEIIKKYEPWLSYWQSTPDNGQYDAVQNGFDRSHGEIMAYLNADDLYFPWTLAAVAEIFEKFPRVEWLTTSLTAAISSDAPFPIFQSCTNRSSRWFFKNRGKLLLSRGFIQQESTFWRRSLWERAGARLDNRRELAGDLELWARFYQHANLVTVNIPLGIFRFHASQRTTQIHRYILDANQVLASYPNPMWVPHILIRVLNSIYRRINTENNWLGARCDKILFDPRENSWHYIKALEGRD